MPGRSGTHWRPPPRTVSQAWADQVVEAFLAVLRRPRFGITVLPNSGWGRFIASCPDGSEVPLEFVRRRNSPILLVYAKGSGGRFHFDATFTPSDTPSVRKAATSFARKLLAKHVYDTLRS